VILPFRVLLLLDCVLEPNKAAVLEEKTLRACASLLGTATSIFSRDLMERPTTTNHLDENHRPELGTRPSVA
jgi:hypothetical protein